MNIQKFRVCFLHKAFKRKNIELIFPYKICIEVVLICTKLILNKNYLHTFKMADGGHLEFKPFDIIHLESNVIPNFNKLIASEKLFLCYIVL